MCGRFSLSGDVDFYAEYFGAGSISTEALDKSWNVAPTDPVYVVAQHQGERLLGSQSWGLVPHWAPDRKSIQINARMESIATKPIFRESFAKRRCLIPADGFYEWESTEQGRTPHWIFRADGFPMAFAGIWANWKDQATDVWHRTCSIITTKSAGVIVPLHDRMPVSLVPEVWDTWLDRELNDPNAAFSLLRPTDGDLLMEHQVPKLVNSVKNNGPELQAWVD